MHGGPLGDPEIFCVRVLGATGLSLTPLSPSQELLSQQGVSAAALPWGSLSPHLGMGGLGTLELVKGDVGSLVACGAAQGLCCLGRHGSSEDGTVFSPGEVLG